MIIDILCVYFFLCFGNEASRDRYVGWSVQHKFQKSYQTHTRRRKTSYDVARLILMVPSEPWRNSTPFFGAAAFCTTKIDDFRTSLMLSSLTT